MDGYGQGYCGYSQPEYGAIPRQNTPKQNTPNKNMVDTPSQNMVHIPSQNTVHTTSQNMVDTTSQNMADTAIMVINQEKVQTNYLVEVVDLLNRRESW